MGGQSSGSCQADRGTDKSKAVSRQRERYQETGNSRGCGSHRGGTRLWGQEKPSQGPPHSPSPTEEWARRDGVVISHGFPSRAEGPFLRMHRRKGSPGTHLSGMQFWLGTEKTEYLVKCLPAGPESIP